VSGAGIVLLVTLAVRLQAASCREAELTAMLRAQEQIARGDVPAARNQLEAEPDACQARRVAQLALAGWNQARALAAKGGAVDLQGPVRQTLQELATHAADAAIALEVDYAITVITAAIAAAQDERPEMELLLTHARDLSERLLARDRRAQWPLSFNLAAGELWFEVDRYADAAAAYERAVRADASPLALAGLGRSLARLDRLEDACAALRRMGDAAPLLRAAAAAALARCP
jgi:tetratricopeptide (TPR) repeat protein